MKKLIREREKAPLLRPGQLQALQLPARQQGRVSPGVQVRSADALQRAHGAEASLKFSVMVCTWLRQRQAPRAALGHMVIADKEAVGVRLFIDCRCHA